jgi:hypothetical protein
MADIGQREPLLLQPGTEVCKLNQVQPGCGPAESLLSKPVGVPIQVITEWTAAKPRESLWLIKEPMHRSPLE